MLFPPPDGPDQGHAFSRPDVEAEAVEGPDVRPPRIGEADAFERHRPPRRLRQDSRRGRGDEGGPRVEDLGDPRHGPGALLHVAPGLAERAGAARREHRQKHELQERPRRHPAGDEGREGGAPQNEGDAPEHEDGHQRGHHRPGADPGPRLPERRLHRLAELQGDALLLAERLHGLEPIEVFAREADGGGEPRLGPLRQPPHPASDHEQRRHDQQRQKGHEAGQGGADDDHNRQGDRHRQQVPDRHRRRGPDQALDHRQVARHPREDLAGPGPGEEGLIQRHHVGEQGGPQVGDHPFSEPVDEVEPRRGGEGQDDDHRAQQQEIAPDQGRGVRGDAPVGEPAQGEGQADRRRGRDEQRDGPDEAVPRACAKEGAQPRQRRQIAPPPALDIGRHCGRHAYSCLFPAGSCIAPVQSNPPRWRVFCLATKRQIGPSTP